MSSRTENNSDNGAWRRYGIYAVILVVVFLLGFVPMWVSARGHRQERDRAEARLRVAETENLLASAALNSARGEYEPARQATSEFYTRLRAEVDRRDESAIAPQYHDAAEQLLATRDDTITLLARNDPAAATRLNELYFTFRRATGRG